MKIEEGDVVLIKDEERNRGKWKIGIVVNLIRGRDGIVRAAKLRTGTTHIERAVQHLYPMELECDIQKEEPATELNPQAREFRPRRKTATEAAEKIKAVVAAEDEYE